ncbi:MAG: SUF system NifU family Fe-S cluster assembly protein [Bacteriovoracaceae bacterium]|nr:SUF system NifU family Fe-S cluster assembly protein [Bacteriovoracaceae bacterium]
MNENLQELYQSVILDHNKNPRNFKKLETPTHHIEGFNPLCGDHLWLYLNVKDDVIVDISFEGQGCAISKASASMMTEALKGKNVADAQNIFNEMHALLTHKLDPDKTPHHLGKLQLFSGVWKYPARVKCAILPWRSLSEALSGTNTVIKTE